MSNLGSVKVSQAFKHLDPNQGLGEGIYAGFTWINYRGKVWSLRHNGEKYAFVRADDGEQASYIDVIIVGFNPYVSKVYYPPGEFNENASGPPTCASVKGDVPDPGVKEPQSKTCALCPHNEFRGQGGRECQDHRRLAVLLMPTQTAQMLGAPLREPVFLKIPPGSLTTLKKYGDSLVHEGIPFPSVITRIWFNPDKLFQMEFKVQRALDDSEAPVVLPWTDDPQTKRIIGQMVTIRETELPPPIEETEARPVKSEPVETGIAAAFAAQPAASTAAPAKRRGRPPKPPQQLAAPPAPPSPPPMELQEANDNTEESQSEDEWEDADTEVVSSVKELMKKSEDMFK